MTIVRLRQKNTTVFSIPIMLPTIEEQVENLRMKKKGIFHYQQRTCNSPSLFQIKHYKNPVLGDALKRIVTGTNLYACYVSYPSKGGRDLYFSSIFYVAETNEEQKIMYEKSFNSDTGIWYHPVDLDTVTVIDEGKLIATEKYQAPEEATSLVDYNKE